MEDGTAAPDHCEACEGSGMLFAPVRGSDPRIERCDACGVFGSDAEATERAWAIASTAINAGQYPARDTLAPDECPCGDPWCEDTREGAAWFFPEPPTDGETVAKTPISAEAV